MKQKNSVLNRSPESLTVAEREGLTGKWIALPTYSPETLPLRQIAAVGDTAWDCIRQLRTRGEDVTRFYFEALSSAIPDHQLVIDPSGRK